MPNFDMLAALVTESGWQFGSILFYVFTMHLPTSIFKIWIFSHQFIHFSLVCFVIITQQSLVNEKLIFFSLTGDSTPADGQSSSLSPLRVSAIQSGGGRLWIGTHTGLIVSVPFTSSEQQIMVKAKTSSTSGEDATTDDSSKKAPSTPKKTTPGSIVQVYASPRSHTLTPGTNMVPYCWVGGAQISCHGHTDSVKAIVCSPVTGPMANSSIEKQQDSPTTNAAAAATSELPSASKSSTPSLAVMSVGEGYRDCRSSSGGPLSNDGLSAILTSGQQLDQPSSAITAQPNNSKTAPPGEERIHMIVWQLALNPNANLY